VPAINIRIEQTNIEVIGADTNIYTSYSLAVGKVRDRLSVTKEEGC
jgi:hypothetical protein